MSHINKIVRDIEKLIQQTRGISLNSGETDALDHSMQKLNSHFHCLHRPPCPPPESHPLWPDGYLKLEADYCRVTTLQKRREFNNHWNDTHVTKFYLQDGWRNDL